MLRVTILATEQVPDRSGLLFLIHKMGITASFQSCEDLGRWYTGVKPGREPVINSKSCSWWRCYHCWLRIGQVTWVAGGLHLGEKKKNENPIWVTRICGQVAPPTQAGNHADGVKAISPEQYHAAL